MKPEVIFDAAKIIQVRMSIQNAHIVAALFVTLQESFTKLSKLFELISYSLTLKEAIQSIHGDYKFFEVIIPHLNQSAAMSMQLANAGNRFLSADVLMPERNIKIERYLDGSRIENYRCILMVVPFFRLLDRINKKLDLTLFSTRYEVEDAVNEEQKNKAVIAVSSIAQVKSEIAHLHKKFNEIVSWYNY